MFIAVACSLLLHATPGLQAKKPIDKVKELDAVMADMLRPSEKLEALLATEAEMKTMLKAAKVNGADMEVILRTAMEERVPSPELPATFTATIALVEVPTKGSGTHNVRFYDAAGYRLDFSLLARGKGAWALEGAPRGQPAVIDDDLEYRHAQLATDGEALPLSFTKGETGWVAAKFPAADEARCQAMMHAHAKRIHAAQVKHREANGGFDSGGDTTNIGSESFMGWTTIKRIDKDHFKAEVNRHGGQVVIDETGTITDVKPCALTPGKGKGKAKKK